MAMSTQNIHSHTRARLRRPGARATKQQESFQLMMASTASSVFRWLKKKKKIPDGRVTYPGRMTER